MADFIDFEAEEVDENDDVIMISDDEQVREPEDEVSNFIDNSVAENNDPSFYRSIENQELQNVGNVDEILQEELEQSYLGADDLDLSNICDSEEELEPEINFSDSEKGLKRLQKLFFPKG